MKHIFTVHSPITYLMAHSIVLENGIDDKDIVVIASKYELPLKFGKTVRCFSEVKSTWYKKLLYYDTSKAYDKYLNKIIGSEDFIAYVDIMHAYQKLLITNNKCKLFYFFEEGTDSYMTAKNLSDFTRTALSENFRYDNFRQYFKEAIRVFRGYPTSLYTLPYHPQSYQFMGDKKYFCLSKYCYPGVADHDKNVIKPSFTQSQLQQLSSNISLENAVVLIEETYPDVYGVSDVEYQVVLEYAFENLDVNGQPIYLKMRPNKRKENSRLVMVLDKMDIHYEILPNAVLAEGIFLNSKDLTVIGFVSSLLIYASIFGQRAFSLLERLKNKPLTRFENINGFWKLVESL